MAGPYPDFTPAPDEADRRQAAEHERRSRFRRVFAGEAGAHVLLDIMALGGIAARAVVAPADTPLMLAEHAGRRRLALDILELAGGVLCVEILPETAGGLPATPGASTTSREET